MASALCQSAVHARVALSTCVQHTLVFVLLQASCCVSCRFKRNGKKLVPSSQVVVKLMAPLLLWVAAVMVIYGVSYSNLQGLQGPLASLVRSSFLILPASDSTSDWLQLQPIYPSFYQHHRLVCAGPAGPGSTRHVPPHKDPPGC